MRIGVTGCRGFIGWHFCRMMTEIYPEDELVGIDLPSYAGTSSKPIIVGTNYREILGIDLRSAGALKRALTGCDVVVNFAAHSHVDRSIFEPDLFLAVNTQGVQNLLELVRSGAVGRLIQVSTDEVYGPVDHTRPVDESAPIRPGNPYAASKAAADLLCLAYFNTYRCPVRITRGANTYGPWQYPEKLIPVAILRALADQPIPIYGTGTQIRQWIHVEDHCRAIDCVLRNGTDGEIYNISPRIDSSPFPSPPVYTNRYVVYSILLRLGKSSKLIEHIADRPGHDVCYATTAQKLAQLGWEPRVGFMEGLDETIDWYRENQNWAEEEIRAQSSFFEKNYAKRNVRRAVAKTRT